MTTTAPRVLDSLDELDGDWLEAVLRHSGIQGSVRGFAVTRFGDGKISDTARVSLEYADPQPEAPSTLICKFHSALPAAHGFAQACGLYRGEFEAYRAIAEHEACLVPHPYWAAGDDERINLVLEDLSEATEPGNQVLGTDVEHGRAVLLELANLHTRFYPLAPSDAPAWMTRMSDAGNVWVPIIAQGATLARTLFSDRLSAEQLSLIERGAGAARAFFDAPGEHLTLTHGDPRVDNVLFTPDTPPGAVIIDWQNVGLRNPMFDVGYFMSGSISPDDRREHENDMLGEYIEKFARTKPGYDLATAREQYRVGLISGLMQTLAGVAFICSDDQVEVPDDAATFLLTLLGRNIAAVADWESIDALGH